MSKSVNSPTARLLQSSRLFSLPRSLPTPPLERTSVSGIHRASDSATLPYPILQAVATPRASQARGDWGLKRPLPSKPTRETSTPHIRVYANDTPDCITEFSSAADHTQSRSKWQQMGVPIVRLEKRESQVGSRIPPSVYEDELDITDPDYRPAPRTWRVAGNATKSQAEGQRWKFSGPWLVGMQAGEFNQYLAKTVAGRKDEWREFLRNNLLDSKIRDARVSAQNTGEPFDQAREQQLREQLVPTDAEVDAEQKALRDDHLEDALSSRLTALVSRFLDLAQPDAPREIPSMSATFGMEARKHLSADAAPPVTHPGAGLSYARSAAVMDNHPLYGPQGHRSPVLARVMAFRNSPMGRENYAKLGVGGFVTVDATTQTFRSRAQGPDQAKSVNELTEELDPTLEGGAKIWVHPETATVNDKGTVRVTVVRGDEEAIAVKAGRVDEIHEGKRRSFTQQSSQGAVQRPEYLRTERKRAEYGTYLDV